MDDAAAGQPDDYILASGIGHTVAEFAECAFASLGLCAEDYVSVDAALRRPREPTPRVGDPSRARERLGWRPTLSFEQLVQRMVGLTFVPYANSTMATWAQIEAARAQYELVDGAAELCDRASIFLRASS